MIRILFAALLLLTVDASAFDMGFSMGGLGSTQSGHGSKNRGISLRQLQQGMKVAQALIPISDEQERKLGRGVAGQLIARYGVDHVLGETYFLNLLGNTLAAHSDRPDIDYHFAILATDDVNAYACPGGYIFVTRGTLAMVRDEAELAAVLAHEIAHVTERHIIKALQKSDLLRAGTEIAADAFVQGSGQLFDELISYATNLLFEGLEKDDEYDSDRQALVYLDQLGYDYRAMYDILRLLDDRRKAGQSKVLTKTHPAPLNRLHELKNSESGLKLEKPTTVRLKSRFSLHIRS